MELTKKALDLMKEERDIEELITYYNDRTQYYKVDLLKRELMKVKKNLERNI